MRIRDDSANPQRSARQIAPGRCANVGVMRTILLAERRREPLHAPAVAPRDLRRARNPRRHGLRTPCRSLPAVSFSLA
jgi:hypothetical protein